MAQPEAGHSIRHVSMSSRSNGFSWNFRTQRTQLTIGDKMLQAVKTLPKSNIREMLLPDVWHRASNGQQNFPHSSDPAFDAKDEQQYHCQQRHASEDHEVAVAIREFGHILEIHTEDTGHQGERQEND